MIGSAVELSHLGVQAPPRTGDVSTAGDIRAGPAAVLEGNAPLPRISIIVFDSLDKAQAWYKSAAYQKLIPVRQSVMKTNSFIAENPN
jgi:hypothetical protein